MPHKTTCLSPDAWRRTIVQYIADHPDRPLKARGLARELRLANEEYPAFREIIRQMLGDGSLALGPARRLTLPECTAALVGVFRAHPRGFGFIEAPGRPDSYVGRGRTGGAREGDTVAARLVHGRGPAPHAEVTRIIERAPLVWVGVLERTGDRWLVQPQGKMISPPVYIDDPTAKSARPGDLVVVEPLEHTLDTRTVRGVIVERLGDPSETQTKIRAVMRRYALADQFPPEVRHAAQRAAARFEQEDFGGREDLRDLLTITIDPADARDFDDAISLEPLADGEVRLGVHIADVSHFVRPDGPLDQEARQRSTSVYFPGYVVPMLPEVLSNGVCSLQPGEPRLTKSVFLTYDAEGRVVATRFANSAIRSRARLTYEQATAALAGQDAGLEREVRQLLRFAEALARRIRQRRSAQGMLVLALPEVEIRLDDSGRVVDSGPADSSFSHTLIEMFMVEANEAVSRALRRAHLPHLRRVHPEPDPEAARALGRLVPVLGRDVPRALDRDSIRALLAAAAGQPAEAVVNMVVLRALAQAYYSPADEGHFALASDDYCHFTSPIRRYPDLVDHRLLDECLRADTRTGRRRLARESSSEFELAELGRHASAMERRAQQAERDVQRLLLLELMKSKLGETFDGIIMDVVSFGAFIRIQPFLAEGLIRVADFGPGLWDFDASRGAFAGRGHGRVVMLGQRARVLVAAIDELRQEICLVPADASFGVPPDASRAARGRRAHQRQPRRGRR